jgi:hypothetical protein
MDSKDVKLKIAFFKGSGLIRDRFIRVWTGNKYSHVELVIPGENMWLGIRPPEYPHVRGVFSDDYNDEDWDFITIEASKVQLRKIKIFYNKTKGCGYDWVGMALSHMSNFRVKHKRKWYCSEWVIHALEYAGVINNQLFEQNRLPPSKVYEIISKEYNEREIF